MEHLKKAIPTDLKDVDARRLKLYRFEIDASYNKKKRINELKQLSQQLNECTELDEVQPLSECLGGSPPPEKKYYIIMQIPEGASIYCGSVVLWPMGFATTDLT